MKIRNNILLLALLSFSFLGYAQDEFKKANKLYDGYSYSQAIEEFEPIENKSVDIKRKLAESYNYVGNTVKSETYYAEVVVSSEKTPEDYYNYASTLSKNGKYSEAEKWMLKFAEVAKDDSRAKAYKNAPEFYKKLQKDNNQFTIKNIELNSEQEDFGPTYFKDKLVFASSREGVVSVKRTWNWNGLPFLDIYLADLSEENELTNLKEFSKAKNKKFHEGPAAFDKEGNYMVFTRNNYKERSKDGVVKLELYETRLINGFWEKEKPLPFNNSEYSVGHPTLSADGNTMYFASDMPGGFGGVDLYKSTKTTAGTWGDPVNLGAEINSEGDEMFPFIHEKEELFFFSSNGHVGLGGLDVFVCQVKDGKFGQFKNVGVPVNGSSDDFSFILNGEQKQGFFASNRAEGRGDDDIYSFKLLKPFNFGVIIKGETKDEKGNIVPEAFVTLYDEEKNVIDSTYSDKEGKFEFVVDPNKTYEAQAVKDDYFEVIKKFEVLEADEYVLELILEKDPGLSLYALVKDKKTGAVLEGVNMIVVDNMTGDKIEFTTPATGDYRRPLADKKLNDRGSYNFTLSKEGYFSKTVTYNVEFKEPGQYDVHSTLDLGLDPEVKDLSEMVEINPINFDYNKYNIRKDAAVELDKIVEIMNKYPGMVVELGSHTDSRGSSAYNKKLSERRAKASASYIKKHISDPDRIYGKGYGESQIINRCVDGVKCSDEEHEVNRRTEFKVISTGNDKVKVKNNSTDSFN